MLSTFLLAAAFAGHAEASGASQGGWFTAAHMLWIIESSSDPSRAHRLDLTPLAIPPRVEFPSASEILEKHMDFDTQIKSYEEIIAWLKENAPEKTDQNKRFEKHIAELKEMKKEKNKDVNRRRQD